MKRTPLARKTPLTAKKPMNRGKCQLKRTELAPVGQKRLRDNRRRTVNVNAMRMARAGRCANCGRNDVPVYGHERLARVHGGDFVRPDALACNLCNGSFEDNPRVAAWNGWKISAKWPHDPALTATQARDLYGNVVEFTAEGVA